MTVLASSIQSFQKGTNPTFVILMKAEKSHSLNDRNAAPPTVISTEAKGSGEISPSNGTGGITAGDLSTQSFMGARVFTIHIDTQLRSR